MLHTSQQHPTGEISKAQWHIESLVCTGVFVIMPCSTNAGALFDNDEVVALVPLDEINCHAHAC
jgi:hypothetical protein